MPWRDEISIDDVEYSDRPKASGPAPGGEDVERGQIVDVAVEPPGGGPRLDAEFQFWRSLRSAVDVENPGRSAAGYLAWRIDGRSGDYGVFDGHARRVWLDAPPIEHAGETYECVALGQAWRDKVFWNDFVDRLWSEHMQYPWEQDGALREVDAPALVPTADDTSAVYEVDTVSLSSEWTFRLQLWRAAPSQAVFVAVEAVEDPAWSGHRGVIGREGVLTDCNFAISFDDEAKQRLLDVAASLRTEDVDALAVVGADAD